MYFILYTLPVLGDRLEETELLYTLYLILHTSYILGDRLENRLQIGRLVDDVEQMVAEEEGRDHQAKA